MTDSSQKPPRTPTPPFGQKPTMRPVDLMPGADFIVGAGERAPSTVRTNPFGVSAGGLRPPFFRLPSPNDQDSLLANEAAPTLRPPASRQRAEIDHLWEIIRYVAGLWEKTHPHDPRLAEAQQDIADRIMPLLTRIVAASETAAAPSGARSLGHASTPPTLSESAVDTACLRDVLAELQNRWMIAHPTDPVFVGTAQVHGVRRDVADLITSFRYSLI